MATTVGVITTRNDGINPPDNGLGATHLEFETTIRLVFPNSARRQLVLFEYDQWRGYSFFQTADTAAPHIGRKTVFPKAD